MKTNDILKTLFFLVLFSYSASVFSQDDDQDSVIAPPTKPKSRLLTGFYVSSYFANKYSASAYNGYGFDINGARNSFLNSLMYQKIVNEYGGGYGQTDLIAQALGVDPGQWQFTESDMAVNMHYNPAILVGFNFKIPLTRKDAIILNANGTKLEIDGNFTMTLLRSQISPVNPALNNNIKTFTIIGKEQRAIFQVGYQRILGDPDKLNFFVEAGVLGTLAKFDKNTIYINTLQIDLTNYLNQTAYATQGPFKRPIGFAFGGFAGLGVNIDVNPKITVQLLYTLTLEKVNIGTDPKLKPQNAIGLRAYYNF